MSATNRRRRVAALALSLSLWTTAPARSQNVARQSITERAAAIQLSLTAGNCVPDFPARDLAFRALDVEPSVFPVLLGDDSYHLNAFNEGCVMSRAVSAPVASVAVKPAPCVKSGLRAASSDACARGDDRVALELDSLGKSGAQIGRARQQVLDILGSQNACRAWFATADPAPDLTFQSLGFLIDRDGPEDVLASVSLGLSGTIRQPYVARATQDGGPYTHITINAKGAFYRSQAKLHKLNSEGGPMQFGGEYWLTVGTYGGNTLQAQVLTLLHELGHVINLLPEDSDDLDGKSARNTSEVLRHCRPEIELRAKQAREMAKK